MPRSILIHGGNAYALMGSILVSATGYADTYFSVPAATRHKGKRIVGYFTHGEGGIEFHPMDRCKPLLPMLHKEA